ncbi:MAG: acyl-CoA dehydrogenase family protein [Pseudomonadota bacterium]|nr:acyl-CoA dehydrogenase family protein [Pseudomonadota bacterium]
MKTKTIGKAQGFGLAMLTKFASSELPDRLRVRDAVEKILYHGSKTGFQLVSTASRRFKPVQVKGQGQAARLDKPKKSSVFDLSLSDEQQMVRDNLSRFAREVLRPAAHDADEAHQMPSEILTQATDLGLIYYAVPEQFGGMATEESLVTQMLALEDLGNGDFSLGSALFTSVSVANTLTRYGSAEQQAKYLPAFFEEDGLIATLACNEPVPVFDPMLLQTVATSVGGDFVLNGEKSLVLMGTVAELFIVSAELDGEPTLFIVEGGTAGLTVAAEPAMGLKAAQTARLKLESVHVPAANRLDANYREFLDLGHLAFCALAVGAGQAILDYVVPYVNDRVAFGEPISHRQSVAFMVADIAVELEAMQMMTWRACALAESGQPFHREAHLARILCAEKAMKLGTDSVQLLGGHGFTKEHPVERWYRDLRSLAVMHNAISL